MTAALLIGFGLSAPQAPATIPTAGPWITVHAGETLSQIAARELPTLSVADAVATVQIANNLSTTQVSAGQRLVVPGS